MEWIEVLYQLTQDSMPFAMITIVDTGGSNPRDTGARMFVLETGSIRETIGGGALEEECIRLAKKSLEEKKIIRTTIPLGAKSGQCCGGVVDLLIEPFNVGPILYIFGSGHVGLSLEKILKGTPFKTAMIDGREEWINKACGKKYLLDPCAFLEGQKFNENDSIAIMTHSHELDLKVLSMALKKEFAYIGLIGSENKWLRFKNELTKLGHTEQEFNRVRCPIGLDIGGKAPQEVAISIAAELLKRYYEK